jgi:channel protein (hemolysin III family)
LNSSKYAQTFQKYKSKNMINKRTTHHIDDHHHHQQRETENKSDDNTTTTTTIKENKKYYARCMCGMPLHLMNSMGSNGEYEPSTLEEIANVVTHAIPALSAVFAMVYMLSTVANTTREVVSAVIFGTALILLYTVSSLYHASGLWSGKMSAITKIWQKFDHLMIFIFIAASYTPWLMLVDVGYKNTYGLIALAIVWAVGIFGIVKTVANLFPNQNVLILYLAMGWIAVIYFVLIIVLVYFDSFASSLSIWCVVELLAGGVLYSVGTVFFSLDGKLPFAHAIWHLFIVAASVCHLHAIHVYAMSLE